MATSNFSSGSRTAQIAGKESVLFSPAVWVMNRLMYSSKFILIGLVMVLPFFGVTSLTFFLSNERIDKDNREVSGMEYLRPVVHLLQHAQDHGIWEVAYAAGYLNYDEKLNGIPGRTENPGVRRQIDDDIRAIEVVEKKHGGTLGTADALTAVKTKWDAIRALNGKDLNKSLNLHLELFNKIRELILVTSNYADLVHDPELDSYWLMHAYTQVAPKISICFARATMICADISQRNNITQQDRLSIAALYWEGLTTMQELAYIDLEDAHATAGSKEMADNIYKYTYATKKQADEFLQFLRDRVRDSGAVTFDSVAVDDLSERVSKTMYNLFDNVERDLNTVITRRAEAYTFRRNSGVAIALGATALLLYIFAGFYFSVQRSIRALGTATTRMIAGTSERFTLDTEDEMAQVAISYNEINRALIEARDLKTKTEGENRALQENILHTLQIVSQAADGDLTVRARVTEGALGNVADAFNQMLGSWRTLLSETKALADRARLGIAEIGRSSENMSSGAGQQVKEIVAAKGSVQKMNESIGFVSSNAEAASDAAKRTQQSALEGADSVQKVVHGMESLRANVQAGAKKIKNLGDRSMEITSIVATIAKISDQTNMLALNAAIEAARAGEHGRGFSVVADEIRKLAERTANATQEIEKLVQMIQAETNESVAAIEQQTQFVETEVEVVGQAGGALAKISDVSTLSAKMVADISSSSKAQVQDATNIVKTMERISDIARSTQSGIDRTLKTVRDLSTLSDQLTSSVGKFRLDDAPPVFVKTNRVHSSEVLEMAGAGDPL